ncbi:putative sporulation protein YtxC [Microaerobacter geothermalis]|uniref:putative sporulation protein YtxC n=1 Tax=Microaerobacter geothermalis TaxID=674972 RepID=UPI001F2D1F72|nr:putative sporulation protein YtxC [Microaerobacter geothermalis]MCF6092990.1 putative sporulation protein YtxC [Microaerobacter geothermalis]
MENPIEVTIHVSSEKLGKGLHCFLENKLKGLREEGLSYLTYFSEKHLSISCQFSSNDNIFSRIVEELRHHLSLFLSEYILVHMEKEIVKRIIIQDFYYSEQTEIEGILRYAEHFLKSAEEFGESSELQRMGRQCKIYKKLFDFFERERKVVLEGFIRFRLKEYYEDLVRVVEHSIDEYILEREYQEFIQLLRYFVSIQESKTPIVHVVHLKDRLFLLYDGNFHPIHVKELDECLTDLLDHNMNMDDLIITTLITLAPEQMVIHTGEKDHHVITTMRNIFEDKVYLCLSCNSCSEVIHNHSRISRNHFRP